MFTGQHYDDWLLTHDAKISVVPPIYVPLFFCWFWDLKVSGSNTLLSLLDALFNDFEKFSLSLCLSVFLSVFLSPSLFLSLSFSLSRSLSPSLFLSLSLSLSISLFSLSFYLSRFISLFLSLSLFLVFPFLCVPLYLSHSLHSVSIHLSWLLLFNIPKLIPKLSFWRWMFIQL